MSVATVTAAPGAGHGARSFTPGDVALIVGAFAVSRVVLCAIGLVTLLVTTPEHAPIYASRLFVQWDSYWYLHLAQHGYSTVPVMGGGETSALDPVGGPWQTNYAFYPLYPLAMWLLSAAAGLSLAMAGVVISNACFLGALFLLFALCERWSGDKAVAGLAVALLCAVPEGFVFSAVYTESLFVLLTLASVLLFERRRNFLAGVCAGLGSAVRSNGVFVVIYFGLALLRERGVRGGLAFWKEPERYLPIVMAPIGLFVFWWIAMLGTGDAFAQKSTLLHGWPMLTDWPWVNIVRELWSGEARDRFLMLTSLWMFAVSFTLLRRATWPLFAYCLCNFLLYWTSTSSNSLLRYSIALFPIFYGLALTLAHKRVAALALLVGFAALDALLMVFWVHGSDLTL